MQKKLDAAGDFVALPAANEDFGGAREMTLEPTAELGTAATGWNAFEIWRSRILPGVAQRFPPSG